MDQTQNLENLWMPFSANRAFKSKPRLMNEAKGMYYKKLGGESVLDATSGLWCCNAGHNHPKIVEAIRQQAGKLDYAPSFQMGHPLGFKAAEELLKFSPSPDFKYTFFTNSGSESVDTALKIALGYHQLRGKKEKTILVGRERAYHGVGFGGISVGGLPLNKKHFSLLENVDHISSTHNIDKNAFSKGLPDWGADLANDLLRIIKKHGADKIAAFITEPLAGSTGVLVPPKGYLEKIRKICTDHDILLIFDEVITGFGRLGTPFASQYFNVIPDTIDAYNADKYINDALYRLEIRKIYRRIINIGFVDIFRKFNKKEDQYTFWDYMKGSWQKNNGLRIDHILVTNPLADQIKKVEIKNKIRAQTKPSDHVPVECTF